MSKSAFTIHLDILDQAGQPTGIFYEWTGISGIRQAMKRTAEEVLLGRQVALRGWYNA